MNFQDLTTYRMSHGMRDTDASVLFVFLILHVFIFPVFKIILRHVKILQIVIVILIRRILFFLYAKRFGNRVA